MFNCLVTSVMIVTCTFYPYLFKSKLKKIILIILDHSPNSSYIRQVPCQFANIKIGSRSPKRRSPSHSIRQVKILFAKLLFRQVSRQVAFTRHSFFSHPEVIHGFSFFITVWFYLQEKVIRLVNRKVSTHYFSYGFQN